MHQKNLLLLTSIILVLALYSCKSAEEFTGYSYDPEGVTLTTDREIAFQEKRTIGFFHDGVWISNEFDGLRANEIYRVDEYHYKIIIEPEISPINNSPWYGFRIWSDDSVSVKLELEYPNSRQRYIPAISSDNGETWAKADSTVYRRERETQKGFINLDVTPEPLWVSAQELHTTKQLEHWLAGISEKPFVQKEVAGNSHQGRPVYLLKIAEQSDHQQKGVIIIYNRQHPPEVPGYLTGLYFKETLASDTELARKFRTYFEVWAFPMLNPDGVDNGHWRTNAAGVDLNRDWRHFNQPETAAARNSLMALKERSDRKVFYAIDFHSTGQNVFYPIKKEIVTFPHLFTYRWAERIIEEMPKLPLRVQPFDTDSPIAKNWTYKTFGVDAVTFEVWDELPREQLEKFGVRSAEIFMEKMIEEFEKEMIDNKNVSN